MRFRVIQISVDSDASHSKCCHRAVRENHSRYGDRDTVGERPKLEWVS